MNGWLDGWMINLSFKKNMHTCMHIRMIVNKEKEENNMKKEKQSKQTKNTIKSVANIQEYNSKAT